ncbi:MAG TPA: aromatic-ring-hydroxylating dioxygenase subunit beta [Mycobacteriales bacterium]|nr:aromatic-ring-hydroxylating dioxygenase subunit beta [Mycobacteriales bacterium]
MTTTHGAPAGAAPAATAAQPDPASPDPASPAPASPDPASSAPPSLDPAGPAPASPAPAKHAAEPGAAQLTRAEAEELLYREARLLDTVQLEEWLSLFTEDGLYWLPIEDAAEPADAAGTVSIVYDDQARRAERVYRTLHTPVLDQNPRSRTVHMVGNVEVLDPDDRGDVRVLCNQVIGEIRSGGHRQVGLNTTRWFGARCEFRLRPGRDGWRISLKKTVLIDSDQPLYNLTFLI